MKRHAILVAALASLMLPAAAQAADEKTIECVSQGLDSATVERIDAQSALFISTPPGEPRPPMPASLVELVRAAAMICKARYGWSDSAAGSAVYYAFEMLMRSAMERRSHSFGIDPAGIARLYSEVPEVVRLSMYGDGPPNGSPLIDIVDKGRAAHLITDANEEMAVRYIETLVGIEGARADFILS